LHPFEQIHSRDKEAFPLGDFREYARCFIVDRRAPAEDIAESFFSAAGISQLARITRDENDELMLIHRDVSLQIRLPAGTSPQHALLAVLQAYFGIRHSMRYLNHVTGADAAWFVVQPTNTWARLELANPYVKWFFTPLDRLPDIFDSSFEKLSEAGKLYAEA
jgi:hypothetical protein